MQSRSDQPVAALNSFLADLRTDQIDGASLSEVAALGRPVLRMNAADTCLEAGGRDDQMIADADLAREDGAGDDGPGTGQGKATVNGKAKMPRDRPERHARGQRQQARLQCLYSSAAHSGDRHDFGVGQTGRSDEGPDLLRYLFNTF